MILIFAVDENWNIGYSGGMLANIKEDLKRFRKITEGNIVIMGRRTLEAIPGEKPLSNRINILVTRDKKFEKQGFYILNNLNNLDKLLNKVNPKAEMKVFLTGGGILVDQLFHRCNKAYITKIFKSYKNADTSIPNLDRDSDWKKIKQSKIHNDGNLQYKYVDYERLR